MRLPILVLPMLALSVVTGCQTTGAALEEQKKAAAPSSQSERLVRLADDIASRGENDTAIALYQRASALPDASAGTLVKTGEAYMRAGYPDEAAKSFRAALEKSPNDGPAMMGLGSAMIEAGDIEAGIRALAQAAPVVNTSSAYNRLGVAQTFAGQVGGAQQAFSQALTRAPGDLDIEINMALAAALDGQAGSALPLVQKVVAAPGAQLHHKRNAVLVYGLLGQDATVKSTPPTGLTTKEVDTILSRARTIRAKGSVVARARALGTILG